jgi:hypothetical protein
MHAAEFGVTDIEHVRTMILAHHKVRPCGRPNDRMTATMRIADMVDVRGILSGPISRAQRNHVVAELPYLGFHTFLVRGLTRYAVAHPTRPFPMPRW